MVKTFADKSDMRKGVVCNRCASRFTTLAGAKRHTTTTGHHSWRSIKIATRKRHH